MTLHSWHIWSVAMLLFGGGIVLYAIGKDAGAVAAFGAAALFVGTHAQKQRTRADRVQRELEETSTTLRRLENERRRD